MLRVSSSFSRVAAFAFLLAAIACGAPVKVRFGSVELERPLYAVNNPSLDDGDSEIGRRTFIVLECTDCHRMLEDPGLPRGPRAIAGPVLSDLRRYSAKQLLDILRSSKTGAGQELYGRSMKDYTQRMTARQLVDVIAYLRDPRPPRS